MEQLGNEEGNPITQVPLQVEIRSGSARGCVLIPVSRISSSVCPSDSSLEQGICAIQPSAL